MKKPPLNRRLFLRNSSLGLLGAGVAARNAPSLASADQDTGKPEIRAYRTLGKTGFEASDIGFGYPQNPGLIRAAIESGVNYFDTGRFYGNSEADLGKAIADFDRESLFITTKLYTNAIKSEADMEEKLEACFNSLKVDRIDCLILQGVDSRETVNHPVFHRVFDRYQKEGKVTFRGIACHSGFYPGQLTDSMEDILMTAIEDGRFDLMLLVYNFLFSGQGERVLKAAHEENIGTTIMKSNPVRNFYVYQSEIEKLEAQDKEVSDFWKKTYARMKGFYDDAMKYLEANNVTDHDEQLRDIATRFVLSNEHVDCCLITFDNFEGLHQYLSYSGKVLDRQALNRIEPLRNTLGRMHCRIGCNACSSSCPNGVPVNTILRYHYYFTAKRQEKEAMALYTRLEGSKPDACTGCEGFCEQACPYGVLARPLLAVAHRNLNFSVQPVG